MHHLDGPRIEPRGTPTALVVLLHGYGANGDDLIGLADGWRRWLPQAAFVAPNAPEAIPGMPGALQWFPLTLRDPDERWRGVVAARPRLDRFVDDELARYRLGAGRLVLVGFSQGTMLALHVGLRRGVAPAAIVGYSGLLAGPEHLGEIAARPPVLLIHGAADDLIPVDALHIAREQLAKAGIGVEWHVREGSRPRHRPHGPAPRRALHGEGAGRFAGPVGRLGVKPPPPQPMPRRAAADCGIRPDPLCGRCPISAGISFTARGMATASHPRHTQLVCGSVEGTQSLGVRTSRG